MLALGIYIQVKCEVIVKKLHRMRAMRDMERCLSKFTAYDFARASVGRRPYTVDYGPYTRELYLYYGLVATWADY